MRAITGGCFFNDAWSKLWIITKDCPQPQVLAPCCLAIWPSVLGAKLILHLWEYPKLLETLQCLFVAIMAIVREFADNTHLDALVIAKVKPLRRWCGATIRELLQIRIGCGSCCHPITHAKLYSFQIFSCQFILGGIIFYEWDIPTHWLQRGTPRQKGQGSLGAFCSSSRISATKKKIKAPDLQAKKVPESPSPQYENIRLKKTR